MKSPPIPNNETERLAALYALNILDTPPEARFDRLTRLAKRLFDVPIVLVSLVDAERQWVKSCQGLTRSEIPRAISFCGHTLLKEEPLVVADAREHVCFADNPLVTEAPHIRFYAGQPLHTPDGYAIGTLCLIDQEPREFNRDDMETLQDLATLVERELTLVEIKQLRQELSAANQALQQETKEHQQVADTLRLTQFSIDQAVDPIFWVDQQGRFSYVNEAASRLSGYSQSELLKMSIQDIDPNYQGKRWAFHWEAIKERGSFTVDSYHVTRSGNIFPVEVTFNYLEFDGAAYNCAFVRDITWRRWAMEELMESEEKFQQLVASISDHIYVTELTDGQRTNTYISPNIEKLTGYPLENFVSDWGFWRTLIHPDDASIAQEQFARFEAGQSHTTEYRLIRVDGEIIWIRDSGQVRQVTDQGHNILTIYGVVSNITERKQAEEALRESEARFRTLVEYAPEAIVIIDQASRIVLTNVRVETMFGYRQDEMLGQNLEMLVPARFRERHTEHRRRYLADPQIRPMGRGLNLVARRKDGSEFPVEIGLSFTDTKSGHLFISYITDITERQQAEESLRESEERLQQVFTSLSDHIYVTEITASGQRLNRYLSPVEPLTGYTSEQLMTDWDFWSNTIIHPEDRQIAAHQALKFAQGQNSEVEYRLVRANDEVIWVRDSGRVEKAPDGESLIVYGVVSDITARKKAEEALRVVAAENVRLARAVGAATEGIVISDPTQPNDPLIYVNDAFTKITGYSMEESLGRNCRFLQGPETDPEMVNEIRRGLAEQQHVQVTLLNYRKDGQTFWNELNISPIFADDGALLYFVGIQSDVTERKEAEATLIRFTNQLRTAAEVSKQVAAILDPDRLLEEVVTLLQSRFGLYHVHVYLLNPAGDELLMHAGSGEIGRLLYQRGHKIPVDYEHSLVALATRRRELVVVNDVSTEPDFMPNPLLPETKAEVAVPLIIGDQVLGVFDVQDDRVNRFKQSDLDTLSTLAGQIAVALQNARLFEEQRQTEQALRQSESRNQAILNAIPDLMFRLNRQGEYLDFKTVSPDELYLPAEEFMGKTISDTLPPPLADLTLHHINQALETHKLQIYEYELGLPGKTPQIFESRLTVSGQDEVLAIVRDITERKQAEEAAARRAQLNAFGAAVGLALTQQSQLQAMLQDCTQAMVNHLQAAFGRIWTYNKEEKVLELRASAGLYTHLDGKHSRIPYGQFKIGMIAESREPTLTNDVLNSPGIADKAWAEQEGITAFAGYPLIVDKSLVGVMAMFAHTPLEEDTLHAMEVVASTIAVSIARKQAEEALRHSQQMLSYHLQNTPVGFIQWSLDFEVEEWNPAAEKIFGYSQAEATGRHASFIIPAEVQAHVDQVWQALLNQTGGKRSTNENLTKAGQRIICDWDNTPLLDEAGNLVGVASLIQDITERILAQDALAQARDEALEASRLKSELLAKVSHELRTPLTAIMGFAEMLEFGIYGTLADKQVEPVEEIIDSTKYLTNLVNELLDQAQLDAGQLKLNLTDFNPIDLVQDTKTKMAVLAQTKGLQLKADIGANTPKRVRGDSSRIRQILVNLISNAIKFTDAGYITIELCLFDKNRWAVKVSDTGSGIPTQDQTKIFEAFQQVDGSITRKHRGHGLGLSIVRQLITLMHGEVIVESQIGHGSAFTIILPIEPHKGDAP